MLNLRDDNELDKLSREAADGFSLDQSPDSWAKVSARLDAEMPEKTRRRYLLFFLLALVLGSGGFWVSRISNGDSAEHRISANHNSEANDHPKNGTSQSTNDAASSKDLNQHAQTKSVDPSSEINKPRENEGNANHRTPNDQNSELTSRNNSADIISPHGNQTSSSKAQNSKPKATGKKNARGSAVLLVSSHQVNSRTTNIKEEIMKSENEEVVSTNDVAKESTTVTTSTNNDKPLQADEKSGKNVKTAESATKSEPKEKEILGKNNSRWVFSAVYAPDISTVNFTHTQPAGWNLGVMVDYKLSQKFSLQTGFIYTKKNYKMNGSDYHPPKGTWIDYVTLKDVTGSCSMYDIPVNLRYNAIRNKSSTLFFSAGLSSYLMQNEDYSYSYDYNGMPTTRDRSYSTSDDYLFSVINFSAGFEKKLNKSFSMQVEPFFKQTLTGVGFGSISLNSTGIYFSLRYNPLKASKPIAAH